MKKAIFVFVMVILLVGCSAPTQPTQTDTPDEPSKIVFSTGRDGNVEVYIMNSDGTGQMRLTNTQFFDGAPDISPDGKKVAFLSDRDGNAEVYTMNLDGSAQVNLTNSPGNDTYPDWSPDSQQIVFDSNRDGNSEIYIMNADGSGQTRLTNNPTNDYSAKWSPDGRKIAFTSDRDGNHEVYVMNADGSDQVNLSNHPTVDVSPTWSGDSQKIAFDSNREGHFDIYVMNSDGSDQTRLTYSDVDRFAYTDWSPDGQKILVNVDNGQNWDVYVMDANGRNMAQLLSGPTDDIDARWGPGVSSSAGVGMPTITPLPPAASTPYAEVISTPEGQMPPIEPNIQPEDQVIPGSDQIMSLNGWVEFFASGDVSTDQDSPTALGQVVIFHGPDSKISGMSCQGCYVLDLAADVQSSVPPEDLNGSDIVFRTGETYEYHIEGQVTNRTFSDFFMGNVPIFEVEYLERVK